MAWYVREMATMAMNWSAAGWPWATHCSRDHSTGSCRSLMTTSSSRGHWSSLALAPYYLVMEKSTYEDVLYEVDGPAAVITISREDRLNAFRGQTIEELIHAFKR